MKDRNDRQTGNLLQNPAAKRSARYADRMKAKGMKRKGYWVTDEEDRAVRKLLEEMRPEG